MSTHYRFQWEAIEKASESRPAGYKEDILRTGFVHSENGKTEYVILTTEQYQG